MKVVLTVDVESYTGDYDLEVHGHGKGLDYIIDACRRHAVVATFFVEALGATRWGDEPLRRICRMLLDAGQDVQLHLHPVVAAIQGFSDKTDVLSFQDRAVQAMLLGRGIEALRRVGVDPVQVFRAGDFAANVDTLAAMGDVGLFFGSNRDLDQKSSIRTQLNDHFPVRNDFSMREGQSDLPVSVLRSPFPRLDGPWRHMEISAMGLLEMCDGLERMAQAGYRCATILTHPAEFFRREGDGATSWIRKNCRRLEGLLAYVGRSSNLTFATMGRGLSDLDLSCSQLPVVHANRAYACQRIVQQALERVRNRLTKHKP